MYTIKISDKIESNGLRFITSSFRSTLFSFICSLNNNIKRISNMVKFIYSLGEPFDISEVYEYSKSHGNEYYFFLEKTHMIFNFL